MLQYSTYSVISPEGCASILWKSADKAPDAAEAMGITAERLKELGLIDGMIPEPLGGAHRVEFVLLSGDARPANGESPEAAARVCATSLLRDWLPAGALLLSAHHQDDQAETLLLQLLRGAGPKGLSAMPASVPLGQGTLLRPLLDCGRDDLLAYAREQGLDWLEDPSNADTRLDRNFLRHRLLPELKTRWPATAAVLARSADCAPRPRSCRNRWRTRTWATRGRPARHPVGDRPGRLPEARQRNLLRHWVRTMGFSLPSRAVLGRILAEVLAARPMPDPVCTGRVPRYGATGTICSSWRRWRRRPAGPLDWAPGRCWSLPVARYAQTRLRGRVCGWRPVRASRCASARVASNCACPVARTITPSSSCCRSRGAALGAGTSAPAVPGGGAGGRGRPVGGGGAPGRPRVRRAGKSFGASRRSRLARIVRGQRPLLQKTTHLEPCTPFCEAVREVQPTRR
jgi:hypothetical protein